MIRRLLALGLLVLMVMWWWKRIGAATRREPDRPAGPEDVRDAGPLVRDRVCNTFLPRSRALTLQAGGEELHFCSEACRAKFRDSSEIRSA